MLQLVVLCVVGLWLKEERQDERLWVPIVG